MTEMFIKRPVMTTLVMLAILLFGGIGYSYLPVSDLPNVDFPTIVVSANLPGASPDTMASAVATPLERQFSTIAGIDNMSSSSVLGLTTITLQFSLSRNIDAAALDVQSQITQAAKNLPQNLPAPPSFQKVNPADQPILYMSLNSPTLPLSQVDEYAETLLAQRISMISGVAQVQVFGAQKFAVRVQLDPKAMASRGIGIDEVSTAVQNGNVNLPTGVLQGAHQAFTVQATGQLQHASEYKPLIVSYKNGQPVRLQELGTVYDDVENNRAASWYNGRRSITLAVQRQPGTNTVAVVDAIWKIIPQLKAQMPASVSIDTIYDRSVTIRDSINDVKFTLMLALVLVILVIFLFLRNLSATLIPSLALPMSLVGTFAVMYLLGYSLDNLSLMALTLCVGFVVDDAIVVLENIVRHMELGEAPFEAAVKGSREIAFTIVSMTLSLAAVFIPVLFMGGILGRLLNEFAVTIAVAIVVSGFVSLSLTPMLCSRFLRHSHSEKHGPIYNFFERTFDGLQTGYDRSLRVVLRYRFITLMLSLALVVATGYLFNIIPKGFLPDEDQGLLLIPTEGAQGISFPAMKAHQEAMNAIVDRNPYVLGYSSNIDSRFGGAGNSGRIFMHLVPRNQRPPVAEIAQQFRRDMAHVPGIIGYPQNVPTIRIGGQVSKTQYQYTLQSGDTNTLYNSEPDFEAKLKLLPQLQDVTSDLQIKNPQLNVEIDRDRASALGVSANAIEDALETSYSQRQISTIFAPNNSYRVVMELKDEYQADQNSLALLYVRAKSGQLVPLNAVARLTKSLGPLSIAHLGQIPAVTVSFNLTPGTSLSQAVDAINKTASHALPSSVTGSFQGAAQAFAASLSGLGLLLLMSILVIYLVLGILYESFIHPITILSGLPSAGFGALITLMIFKSDLNLYAFVGVIMLVGIVKKNAIMMIDVALDRQRKGETDPMEAIYHGAILRFRPIMMTTMAALMGTLPIALGLGAGAESRRPLGLAVVGGLMTSQLLTLYITPVVFYYMDNLQTWLGSLGRKKKAQPRLPELVPGD